jgi:hypothetical protein
MTDENNPETGIAKARAARRGRRIGTATGVVPGRPKPLDEQAKKDRKAEQKRLWRRRQLRRQYHAPEQMRAAYLAGQGCSGEEIAKAIGGTSGDNIRSMLGRFGLKMFRPSRFHTVIQIVCLKREVEAVRKAASAADMDIAVFMLLSAGIVAADRDLTSRVVADAAE